MKFQLWFTFKFVSLNHWKQQKRERIQRQISCDLLSNLYLWTIGNNIYISTLFHKTVVIYFQICIFEPLETTTKIRKIFDTSCDLLSNLYLWTIGNNGLFFIFTHSCVVIYFQICIFEPLETTNFCMVNSTLLLWFTFKFVSLNHWKQLRFLQSVGGNCCDLLSNLYLWTIGNNNHTLRKPKWWVVIYFQICIFEPLETTSLCLIPYFDSLWFTFKFVSLNHWKQPLIVASSNSLGCDLLSNLYLWTIGNNNTSMQYALDAVVIYFQICIFEPLETTFALCNILKEMLWFTFKFVSLNHWKQLRMADYIHITGCDLLSNLYLWTIGNNSPCVCHFGVIVVIYFQICIFEPLETTGIS